MRRYALLLLALAACASQPREISVAGVPLGKFDERVRVLDMYPGVTATIVAPAHLDANQRIDLIFYALPNGNTTAQTMGKRLTDSTVDWHFDIQHIAAQTRVLRTMQLKQAVVVYLEADSKSWPSWRSSRGYPKANARIVSIVDQLRTQFRDARDLHMTLTGHSGGGSFMFGFIEGQDSIPAWLERIAFLDANYNFNYAHGEKLVKWLRGDATRTLVVLAYNDRDIMLDGKKVVSDSGGTWRASERMMNYLREPFQFKLDTLGEFRRFRSSPPQIEVLLHPNPENKILHTFMIGEMNGYMHALLVRRAEYDRGPTLLKRERAYAPFVEDQLTLPAAAPPEIPPRDARAMSGSAFIASVEKLSREEREAAILRELMAGNIPSFLRRFHTVRESAAEYEVMPDYLAIGSDADFVRIPMIPYTAQAFCDAFGFVLPTRKMVNDIWAAATTHVDPRPLTQEREAPQTFLQHHRIIESQLDSIPGFARANAFVAGIKKDVVVTNQLVGKANKVAIYGWHYLNGQPIQQVYTGHVDWYVDYSHGIRPVRRVIQVNGAPMSYEKVLADSLLAPLLSDEGVVALPRYEKP